MTSVHGVPPSESGERDANPVRVWVPRFCLVASGGAFGFDFFQNAPRRVASPKGLEHDPEKWEPVFGKDHAQTKSQTMIPIQLDRIMV
jgi:hypothetical protein